MLNVADLLGYIRIYRVNLSGLSILSGLSAPAPILSGQPLLALGSVGAAGLVSWLRTVAPNIHPNVDGEVAYAAPINGLAVGYIQV